MSCHPSTLAIAIAAGVLATSTMAAHADQLTRETMAAYEKGDQRAVAYVEALEEAMRWSNEALEHRGSKLLYCKPEHLELTPERLFDILHHEIEANPQAVGYPTGVVLLAAMQDIFACK